MTAPVARVRYQRALGPTVASGIRARRMLSLGPAGGKRDGAVDGDQARREAGALEPAPVRRSPRTIAAVLAMFASTQHAAATLTVRQHALGRAAARRVEDVVELAVAARPAPNRRAGGGEAAAAQRDGLSGAVEW